MFQDEGILLNTYILTRDFIILYYYVLEKKNDISE